MTTLIHFGVRVLDLLFAAGLIGTVAVLLMTGWEDALTMMGRSSDEPRSRDYRRAAHQSTNTPARIL